MLGSTVDIKGLWTWVSPFSGFCSPALSFPSPPRHLLRGNPPKIHSLNTLLGGSVSCEQLCSPVIGWILLLVRYGIYTPQPPPKKVMPRKLRQSHLPFLSRRAMFESLNEQWHKDVAAIFPALCYGEEDESRCKSECYHGTRARWLHV